jgi:hypothetical protein
MRREDLQVDGLVGLGGCVLAGGGRGACRGSSRESEDVEGYEQLSGA